MLLFFPWYFDLKSYYVTMCCTENKYASMLLQPVPSRGQLQQVRGNDSAGIEIPGLDTATTSTSVHALKKHRLQIKPGSGLYTAMELHFYFFP